MQTLILIVKGWQISCLYLSNSSISLDVSTTSHSLLTTLCFWLQNSIWSLWPFNGCDCAYNRKTIISLLWWGKYIHYIDIYLIIIIIIKNKPMEHVCLNLSVLYVIERLEEWFSIHSQLETLVCIYFEFVKIKHLLDWSILNSQRRCSNTGLITIDNCMMIVFFIISYFLLAVAVCLSLHETWLYIFCNKSLVSNYDLCSLECFERKHYGNNGIEHEFHWISKTLTEI